MAEQETARFGLSTVDVTAGEALIREVQRSAAMVEWLAVRVAALPEDDLTWGLVGRRITPPGTPNGQPTVHVEQRARIHPLVLMLNQERQLLGRLAESAHRCGIEERLLRRIELEGALIAKLIAAILNDPDLEMRPEQKAKFRDGRPEASARDRRRGGGVTRLPGLSAYDRQGDATPQARQARELLWRDNREPSTKRRAIAAGGCWCDEPYGHDWPGKADGAPHPRPERSRP